MDEPVQLAQYVVGDMLRGARFAVKIDGYLFVAETQLADEGAQILDGIGHIFGRIDVELLIVDRQNERAGAASLLRERAQVAVAGHTQHFDAFSLDGRGQGANTKARSVLRAIVFIDDDDGETKFHSMLQSGSVKDPRYEAGSRPAVPDIYHRGRDTTSRKLHRFRKTASVRSLRPRRSSPAKAWYWKTPT